MARSAILSVRIVSDAKQGQQGMEDMATGVDRLEQRLDRLTVPAGLAMAAVVGLGREALNSASELQQSAGAVSSVFGTYAAEVERYAQSAATNVGLAQSQYSNMASVLGSQLQNMGFPMEQVAGQTNDLIGLGSDLAATFGGTTADAVSALSSLMRGERDPIERYGVSINQAAIDAQMAAMGLDGLTGEAERNAQAQATLALLTEQTANAQGQFARETDTAAGSAQIAAAQFEDAKAKLGEQLLPAVTAVTTALGGLAQWAGENTTVVTALVGTIALFAGGILAANAAIKVYRATQAAVQVATKAWTVVQAALNVVMALNPITLVVIAIVALIAAIVIAYQKSEAFRNIVQALWAKIKEGAAIVANAFRSVIDWVSNAAGTVRDTLGGAFDRVQNVFNTVKNSIMGGFRSINNLIERAKNLVSGLFNFSMPGWMRSVGNLFSRSSFAPEDTSALARATTSQEVASAGLVAPAVFAPSSASAPAQAPAGISIVVNGALDPVAVGRQIEDIMRKYGRRAGGAVAGAF